jgi:hypothetical protein
MDSLNKPERAFVPGGTVEAAIAALQILARSYPGARIGNEDGEFLAQFECDPEGVVAIFDDDEEENDGDEEENDEDGEDDAPIIGGFNSVN